jgi:hypothetical protein
MYYISQIIYGVSHAGYAVHAKINFKELLVGK